MREILAAISAMYHRRYEDLDAFVTGARGVMIWNSAAEYNSTYVADNNFTAFVLGNAIVTKLEAVDFNTPATSATVVNVLSTIIKDPTATVTCNSPIRLPKGWKFVNFKLTSGTLVLYR